ncbi:MAG TPA: hypothetical protein VGM82_02140 [Gemmatimonadaceae bacterium]
MAIPPTLKSAAPIVPTTALDPVTQKLTDLEARIAQLEGAVRINSSGGVTLKSDANISIEAGMNVTIKSMAATTVQASGGMTVAASGTLTMKGSTINLN